MTDRTEKTPLDKYRECDVQLTKAIQNREPDKVIASLRNDLHILRIRWLEWEESEFQKRTA